MNRYIKKLGILALSAGLLAGCTKGFLEEQDPSNFTQDNYYTKPEHARAAVNAIYAGLRFMSDGFGTFGGSPFMMLEFPTGLCNTDVGQNQDNTSLRNLTYNADNQYLERWWNQCYKGIANANLAIARIPGITMDETLKKQYLGEAYYLRALQYFYLIRIFGNIPLIKEPITFTSPDLYPTQADPNAVYELIISDLKAAEAAGLTPTDTRGYASQGAVKSLLSLVYLTMAGEPMKKGAEYYQLAAAKSLEVIRSKAYDTFPTYEDLHTKAKNNTGEEIFMVQYKTGIATNALHQYFIPNFRRISAFADEFGSISATNEFVASYDANDLRKQEQQFFFTKYKLFADTSKTVNFGGNYVFKWFDRVGNATAQSDLNWRIMRYAEVLLIHAEAANEAGAATQDAYDALNAIRKRAKLAPVSGLNQTQFREAVWRERYHELCYENVIWFDMVRTRKVYVPTTNTFDNFVGHKFTYGPTLQEKNLLFPIPTREIKNNKNIKQHTPWL
ncbi:putative outer membrane starch-binding protein [Chitinophaga skermanii]|uniref:Putative outer membrane starch-binding protein n=1 Tax=Chitinophaga skermanii TaxID=331697 RepID=A0A327R1A9_9BACT|nr:RagB/SusD family nutrient uptake outer membrane protein [Chitinophaga skermanii]RAJ10666.1 putative outer membrane starch-binding protein [Chitinophaga skermanii]